MSYSNSFNIGADNLVLGSATGPVNISSLGGEDILINGVSPGGGGVPAIGDVSFVGNLIVDDNIDNLGNKGNIIFGGQDIYHSTPQVPGQPVVDDISYVTFKQLAEKNETNTFTEINTFKEEVKIQALNTDPVPVFVDKITLNKDGSINAEGELKANGLICENGSTDTNFVKARVFDFRPKGANAAPNNELTGWNLSQKAPEAVGIPADNYLMLQNTQPTGSFNLVKSTFDPNNPTPFDIVLDPQNGQVKTATSFDAPQVNFRKNAVDNWSISQPAAGDPADGTLIIRSPNTLGSVNIFDSASTPWAQFSSVGTTLPKPTTINSTLNVNGNTTLGSTTLGSTTINSTLNVNGNTTLGSTNSLLFGAYVFRPQQFYKDITNFSFNNSAIGSTNLLFNTGNPANQEWTNVNTGTANQPISLILNPGAYKLTIRQTSSGTLNEILGMYVMSDIVLSRPNDNAPTIELAQPTAYSYTQYNGVSGGANPGSPIITMIPGFLTWAVHCTFPNTTGNETANIRVTLTQMPYFA